MISISGIELTFIVKVHACDLRLLIFFIVSLESLPSDKGNWIFLNLTIDNPLQKLVQTLSDFVDHVHCLLLLIDQFCRGTLQLGKLINLPLICKLNLKTRHVSLECSLSLFHEVKLRVQYRSLLLEYLCEFGNAW